jgi:hypothetical protein
MKRVNEFELHTLLRDVQAMFSIKTRNEAREQRKCVPGMGLTRAFRLRITSS